MAQTRWRWRRGVSAVVAGSCVFVLFLAVPLAKSLSLSDPRDLSFTLAFYAVFASLVYWLFARPRRVPA